MLGNISAAFANIFGTIAPFKDGVLRRPSYADNGKGTMTKTPIEAPCKVQVDSITQSSRSEPFSEDDARLIILTDGLDQFLDAGRVQDDDEIEIPDDNVTYRIFQPSRDPMNTHWTCGGRIKPNA